MKDGDELKVRNARTFLYLSGYKLHSQFWYQGGTSELYVKLGKRIPFADRRVKREAAISADGSLIGPVKPGVIFEELAARSTYEPMKICNSAEGKHKIRIDNDTTIEITIKWFDRGHDHTEGWWWWSRTGDEIHGGPYATSAEALDDFLTRHAPVPVPLTLRVNENSRPRTLSEVATHDR